MARFLATPSCRFLLSRSRCLSAASLRFLASIWRSNFSLWGQRLGIPGSFATLGFRPALRAALRTWRLCSFTFFSILYLSFSDWRRLVSANGQRQTREGSRGDRA